MTTNTRVVAGALVENGGNHCHGNNNPFGMKYSRVKFPKFWGDDLDGWIYKC